MSMVVSSFIGFLSSCDDQICSGRARSRGDLVSTVLCTPTRMTCNVGRRYGELEIGTRTPLPAVESSVTRRAAGQSSPLTL